MTKAFYRPLRISMGISCAKSLPDELALNMICDEIHTTLLAMGVPLEKVLTCDSTLASEMPILREMPEDQAFERAVGMAKACLLKLGLDRSVIDQLEFE